MRSMGKFRAWLFRFMAGRNGPDQLGRALLWAYFAVAVASLFWEWLMLPALMVLGYMLFRIFSRNVGKRRAENQKFLQWGSLQKRKWADRKTHRYRSCPYCKATLRLPNKKGKHRVCCPKCKRDFEVKI